MNIFDHSQPHKHSAEVTALAKNRSSNGLKADVQKAMSDHNAASEAQKSLCKIIKDELWDCDLSPERSDAVRAKYKLVAEAVDKNEQALHHRLTQLRQAVAVAKGEETGVLHWFGWFTEGNNPDGTTNVILGVRPISQA